MKNLTKIFMAVCVALFAFACTTDPTEDRGVNLGADGQTTLTLSLEEVRTHINGKVGEQYPLYWSAGDKIAVNGVASDPLSEEFHGSTSATFTVGNLAYPCNIVYPAPAEGVTAAEGLQAVTFLTAQEYVAGTSDVAAFGAKVNSANSRIVPALIAFSPSESKRISIESVAVLSRRANTPYSPAGTAT